MMIDTVPAISSQCQSVNAARCGVWFEFLLTVNTTIIGVEAQTMPSARNDSQDMIKATILMSMMDSNLRTSLAHTVDYDCNSSDKCNGERALKNLLRSVVIEDQFQQELSPLLKVVSSFDAKAAECFNFNNATFPCSPADLSTCKRCEIEIAKSLSFNDQVCATCNSDAFEPNSVQRIKTFSLNNRTQDSDFAALNCQLRGCNSIENVNRVYQASKISLNFDEYFKN
jgi:hypothetical protein